MTHIITVDRENPQSDLIAFAAAKILSGRLVAFPTETVYGLGANALEERAVTRIFEVKGRPSYDSLIVHIASVDDLFRVVCEVPGGVYELAKAFWPGPLTLVLPKQSAIPDNVTGGLKTVAVRIPAHPVALALLRTSGVPIAAPSANRFGQVSPTTAQHVLSELKSHIDLILDGGPTTIGVESTVLDVTHKPAIILRPGGVPREALEHILGPVVVRSINNHHPGAVSEDPQPSPGLLAKHYAPRAKLILHLAPDLTETLEEIARLARLFLAESLQVGLLLADEDKLFFNDLPVKVYTLGPNKDLAKIAHNLYAGLRTLDEQEVDVILAHDFGDQGLGLAIRDRLMRAASQIIGTV
jgi:L-threonylcarbamoyladenylate synthase